MEPTQQPTPAEQSPELPVEIVKPELAKPEPGGPAVEPAQAPLPTPSPAQPAFPTPTVPAPTGSTPSPAAADDVDVIEKEWVDAAESVVKQHGDDPHAEEEGFEDLQVDYLKKRYGKDIKKPGD